MKSNKLETRFTTSYCLIFLLLHLSGFAEEAVVPQYLADKEGPGAITISHGFPADYQAVVLPGSFPPIATEKSFEISDIAFRTKKGFDYYSGAFEKIRVTASTTGKTMFSEFSTNPALNHGSDYQILFDGSLQWNGSTPPAYPGPFNLKIPLQNKFLYSQENGSLVIQIEYFSRDRAIQLDADKTEGTGFTLSGYQGLLPTYEAHNVSTILMQITYTVVPEPSVIALMELAIGTLMLFGSRRGTTKLW